MWLLEVFLTPWFLQARLCDLTCVTWLGSVLLVALNSHWKSFYREVFFMDLSWSDVVDLVIIPLFIFIYVAFLASMGNQTFFSLHVMKIWSLHRVFYLFIYFLNPDQRLFAAWRHFHQRKIFSAYLSRAESPVWAFSKTRCVVSGGIKNRFRLAAIIAL